MEGIARRRFSCLVCAAMLVVGPLVQAASAATDDDFPTARSYARLFEPPPPEVEAPRSLPLVFSAWALPPSSSARPSADPLILLPPDDRPTSVGFSAGINLSNLTPLADGGVNLYVTYAALQVLDVYTTTRALNAGRSEANPAMSGVAGNGAALLAVKGAATAGTIALTQKIAKTRPEVARVLMFALTSATATIVAWNYHSGGR